MTERMKRNMKKWLAVILAAMLLLSSAAALAEGDLEADLGDEDFGFEFMDDGYSGEWVSVDALGFEFCLPTGWIKGEATGESAFSASNEAGTASLSISLRAEGVADIAAWGELNLDRYDIDEANFYDALIVEEAHALTLYTVISDERLIAFAFTRAGEEAMPREYALQIVGSACVLWDDLEVPFGEDDVDQDFDFGEAFEADMD